MNGLKHGKGCYKANNGGMYKGDYRNDYREGEGTLYNKDGTISYEGQLKEGLPHGRGSIFIRGRKVALQWQMGINAAKIASP